MNMQYSIVVVKGGMGRVIIYLWLHLQFMNKGQQKGEHGIDGLCNSESRPGRVDRVFAK